MGAPSHLKLLQVVALQAIEHSRCMKVYMDSEPLTDGPPNCDLLERVNDASQLYLHHETAKTFPRLNLSGFVALEKFDCTEVVGKMPALESLDLSGCTKL